MRAMSPLIHTVIAKAPVALVAVVALPIAGVGEGFASVAEDAFFEPLCGSVLAHEHMRRGCRLSEWRGWQSITVPGENVGLLMVGGVATLRTVALVPGPRCPAKAEPVLAPFALAIAAKTEIVVTTVTTRTVIVELVLDVFLAAVRA
jgi:hypothetical protein